MYCTSFFDIIIIIILYTVEPCGLSGPSSLKGGEPSSGLNSPQVVPIKYNKGGSFHTMTNSGGQSILDKLSGLEKENQELKDEIRKQNNALHKVSQDAESRHQEVLSMLSDQAEENRRIFGQSMELTNDFLALRRGELEYWRTDDKSRRRSDIIKARDEVAHGGQVVA